MRVRHISVTGLFGVFDHEIPLNMDSRITIIHGLNGHGKTVMLRMVNGLLNEEYDVFLGTPFRQFRLLFDDESSLAVKRVEQERNSAPAPRVNLQFSYDSPRTAAGTIPQGPTVDLWGLIPVDAETMSGAVRPGFIHGWSNSRAKGKPYWVEMLRQVAHVHLVDTQRLSAISAASSASTGSLASRHPRATIMHAPELSVVRYSAELAGEIEKKLAEYAAKSQELDRTFPTRLLQPNKVASLLPEELDGRFVELERERSRLTRLGFLEPEKTPDQLPLVKDPSKLDVLSIYVNDVEEKFRVFNELAARIELFTDIVNDRFRYKTLAVHRDIGFVFAGAHGVPLPASALSSGEQHEVVMLYELIFKVRPNSLILIDEPELSLHLAWQQQFLSDLEKIVKLSSVDVLFATHSADIIGEHWDWTVELKGPVA